MPTSVHLRLRPADRRELLSHLAGLDHPDEAVRAQSALAASGVMRRQQVAWTDLLPIKENGIFKDWHGQATALLENPNVTAAEATFLRRILAWRSPGTDGAVRLREIAERVAGAV